MFVLRTLLFFCFTALTIAAKLCFESNTVAPYGKYIYHVSIRHNNEHICSGSIINNRYILTSNSCTMRYTPRQLNIAVGTNSLKNSITTYGIEKIITKNPDDDFIALLQTDRDIEFNNYVGSIDIPDYDYGIDNSPVVHTAFQEPTTGFYTSDKLQKFVYKIYNLKQCGQYYRSAFDKAYLCTINQCHSSMCYLDHGGAVVNQDGFIIGVKVFGDICSDGKPQLHYRVYHYAKWIKANSKLAEFSHSKFSSVQPIGANSVNELNDASIERYPYHVNILRNNQHICSGSIINKRYILTSNICIIKDKAENLFVKAGTDSLSGRGEFYNVEKIIPTYNYNYDIALLRTSKDIRFNRNIKPIDIVKYDNQPTVNQEITLTGWERSIFGKSQSNQLKQIRYQVENRDDCLKKNPFLNEAYMCSTQRHRGDACQLDYGGPIVFNKVQVAIKPFGVRCESNEYHFLLPLYEHAAWIREKSSLRY